MKLNKSLSTATYKAAIYFTTSKAKAEVLSSMVISKACTDSTFPSFDKRKAAKWLYNEVRLNAVSLPVKVKAKPKPAVVYNDGLFSIRYTVTKKPTIAKPAIGISEVRPAKAERDKFFIAMYALQPAMYTRAISKLANDADAEDCVMSSFEKAIRAYDEKGFKATSGQDSLSKWLCRIVDNTALDVLRKRSRHNTYSTDDFSHCKQVTVTTTGELEFYGLDATELKVAKLKGQRYKMKEIVELTGLTKHAISRIFLRAQAKIRSAERMADAR